MKIPCHKHSHTSVEFDNVRSFHVQVWFMGEFSHISTEFDNLDIVDGASSLARETKVQSLVAIIGALSDMMRHMMRHLRKSIHCSLDDSNLGTEVIEWNRKFGAAVDDCVVELTHKLLSLRN